MRTYFDWETPIRSLLTIAAKHGLTCIEVDNGDGWEDTATRQEAIKLASATDEAHLLFRHKAGLKMTVFIVLGNEPEELICDYSSHPFLDALHLEYSTKWEGRKCPQVTR